jgi:hypothetical protein
MSRISQRKCTKTDYLSIQSSIFGFGYHPYSSEKLFWLNLNKKIIRLMNKKSRFTLISILINRLRKWIDSIEYFIMKGIK